MIELDVFRASWLGNSDRGCYFDVWENEGQWYWAVWADWGTVDQDPSLLATGRCGKYVDNKDEARKIPRAVSRDWCTANGIHDTDW